MDPVTLGMAKADTRRRVNDLLAPGNVGQRVFGGRMGTYNNTSPTTFQITCETQAPFDAIQVIFANTQPRYSDNTVQVKAASLPSRADLNGSAASWVTVTKSSLLRIMTRTSPGANRIGYTVSDVIPLSSVARTDGGTKPILVVRAYFSANAALPVVGNGTDDFTNWATRTDGRLWAMRAQTGDGVTTVANFTSTTNISQSPIVGIRYLSRGRVVNVAGVGDSITDGRGTYLGEGFILPAVEALTNSGLAVEYSNFGWSGQTQGMFAERAIDILQSEVRPDVLVFPSNSPNDETTTLTAAGILAAKGRRGRVLAECARHGVRPVLWTMLPVNSAVNPWGSSDALRVADNAEVMALANRGVLVADSAAAVSGATSGGQVQLAAGTNTGGIHPNDAGNAALTAAIHPALARAIGV